jgi:protease II
LGLKWLSDLESPTVRTWVADHNRKTRDFVSLDANGQPDALYQALQARAKELVLSNPSPSVMTASGRLLQKAGGLVLVDSTGVETIIAPKIVEADGSGSIAVAEFKPSPDLTKVAVSYVKNRSDLNNWYVYDLSTKAQIAGPMVVRLAGLGWASDSSGVYYTKWATPLELTKDIRYRRNIFHDLTSGREELVFEPFQVNSREIYIVEDVMINGERVLFAYRNQVVAEIPFGIYMGREKQAGLTRGGPYRIDR